MGEGAGVAPSTSGSQAIPAPLSQYGWSGPRRGRRLGVAQSPPGIAPVGPGRAGPLGSGRASLQFTQQRCSLGCRKAKADRATPRGEDCRT